MSAEFHLNYMFIIINIIMYSNCAWNHFFQTLKKMEMEEQAWIFTRQKENRKYSNSNKNTIFWWKTDKTTWKPPFLREPSISEQFFHYPSLSKL